MLMRATLAIIAIGVAASVQTVAAQPYSYPPGSRAVQSRPLPPIEANDDVPQYDPGYRQPGASERYALPPPGYDPPPRPQYGRRAYPDDEPLPVPPASIYRDQPPPGYEPIDPRVRMGRPNYGAPQGY